MTEVITSDVETTSRYNPLHNLAGARPVDIGNHQSDSGHLFLARPFFGPLLFENNDSDARDHCACERSMSECHKSQGDAADEIRAIAFLSWLRLAIYLAIVSIAIVISFHLNHQPTKLERRMALPLGLLFWVLALSCLVVGFANYVKTVTRYGRRQAMVQTGWKTQAVSTGMPTSAHIFLASVAD